MSKKVRRLFEQFKPESYKISLAPDADKLVFSGGVIIAGKKTGRSSKRITLHQSKLKITSAKLTRHDKHGSHELKIDRINIHQSYEEVRLHSPELLYPGNYTIELTYEGIITRPMSGIYPCFFKHDGKEKRLIATQFESHHARDVFPCIDEPEAKALFDLSLTTPKGLTVVSNTTIKETIKKDDRQTVTFHTTPLMSTYLLAFVIGEMEYKEASTKRGTVIRTYATPDNVRHTDFALKTAVDCLEFYEDYFEIPYPLEKCDLLALPDFAAGAMENWGCITFREHALLVDPRHTSLSTKQYVAMVIAHELAHQWFGNLVTMRWWTDLWLNEGFASWVEYIAVDHLFPDWHMWTQFIVDEQQQAMRLDALENTHPIEVPINHPDEIRSIFDAISYSKGSSVIHMLHDYLGKETFRDGLVHYLKKHMYGNTDTVDLWTALEEASQKPVRNFMHQWTTKAGFPIVSVSVNDKNTELSQQRFYINPTQAKKDHSTWPVVLATDDANNDTVLDIPSLEVLSEKTKGLKLNRGQAGFYRVIYDKNHLGRLAELIKNGKLAEIDRLGLLADAFEAAKAGQTATADALQLLDAYRGEDNNSVWDVISSSLASIRLVMDDDNLREKMKPFIRKLCVKQLKRLGWTPKEDELYFDKLLRPTILSLSSLAEEPSVVKEALRKFQAMHEPDDVPADLLGEAAHPGAALVIEVDPDLRGVVYGTAVRHGGQAEFDKLLAMHNASTSSEERNVICAALTGFKQPELIDQALALITTDNVRLQDVAYWVAYSFMNRHAKRTTWEWLHKNWSWLEESLEGDLSFHRMPVYAARGFSDPSFLTEYKKFFADKHNIAMQRSIKQGIEIIEWQSAWKERDLASIKKYFSNQG